MVKILIDGVDKTKEIESCEPINNVYSIKYKNSDKQYNYSEKRVQIEGNSNWQNNLKYFKELASKISIVIENYNVLEDRYKNNEIVKNIMDGITNIFIFDLLIGESDRTLRNIEIIESGNIVTLAPLYDTSSILSDKNTALGVDKDDYLKSDLDKLNKFIENSDYSYKEKFYSYLNTLDFIGIEIIIEKTEKENGIVIDDNPKKEIITKFNERINMFKDYEKRASISK